MKTLPLLFGALCAAAVPLAAAEDPIAARQALMRSVGANAGVAGAVMKGELDYDPAVGRAVIAAIAASATTFGDYFPEGSLDTARSEASPRIWEDRAGFDEELSKLQAATAAAAEASGREGPADAAAFTAAVQPVLGACRSCHESYRIDN